MHELLALMRFGTLVLTTPCYSLFVIAYGFDYLIEE